MRRLLPLLFLAALVAAPDAAAQDDRPDLSGTWKLQRPDSLPRGARVGARPGGGSGSPMGRQPGGAPGRAPVDSLAVRLAPSLTIAQTDSTITIAGERLPSHTYFTDGREERQTFTGVEMTVRAWWDDGDLVIERERVPPEDRADDEGDEDEAGDEEEDEEDEGFARKTIQTYRFDDRGPRLIVITEVEAERGAIRLHRIYERQPEPASPESDPETP